MRALSKHSGMEPFYDNPSNNENVSRKSRSHLMPNIDDMDDEVDAKKLTMLIVDPDY